MTRNSSITLPAIFVALIMVVIIAMFNSPFLFTDNKQVQKQVCAAGYGLLGMAYTIGIIGATRSLDSY